MNDLLISARARAASGEKRPCWVLGGWGEDRLRRVCCVGAGLYGVSGLAG